MASATETRDRNVRSRAYYRGKVTNLSNTLLDISTLTQLELNQKLTILENIQSKLTEYNNVIQDYYLTNDPDNYQTEMESCEAYDDTIINLITEIKMNQSILNSNTNNNLLGNVRSYLKSPVSPLPEFH